MAQNKKENFSFDADALRNELTQSYGGLSMGNYDALSDEDRAKRAEALKAETMSTVKAMDQQTEDRANAPISPEERQKVFSRASAALKELGVQAFPEGVRNWISETPVGLAFASGQATDQLGLLWADRIDAMKKGGDLPPDKIKYLNKLQDLADYQVLVSDKDQSFIKRMLYGGLQFAGQMTQSTVLTGEHNATTAALAAGNLAGLASAPALASPVTAPVAMAQIGTAMTGAGVMTSGLHTYKVEKGGAAQDFVKAIDKRTGLPLSPQDAAFGAEIVGNLNAGIESAEMILTPVLKLIPGAKHFSTKVVTQALLKTPAFMEFVTKWGTRWAAGVGSEVLQEASQEIVPIITEALLTHTPLKKAYQDPANRRRVLDVAEQTAIGVGTLGLTGAAINARGDWRDVQLNRNARDSQQAIMDADAILTRNQQTLIKDLSYSDINQMPAEGQMGPPIDSITRAVRAGQVTLPWTETKKETTKEEDLTSEKKGAPKGEQMELPGMGGPQPPVPPTPPTPPTPPAPPAAPSGTVTPVPAATVGPELAAPATTVEPPLPIQTLQQRLAALQQAQSAMPEANAGPPVAPTPPTPPVPPTPPMAVPTLETPALAKTADAKVELDNKPVTFDENGKVAAAKPVNYYEVLNPEVYADKHFVTPAVLLRDGTVIKGDVQHLPFGPNSATKEAQESYDAAQRALVQKLMDQGIKKEQIAFDYNERLDKWLPAFGWVVPTPAHGDQNVPTFISNSQRDNSKDFGDKLHQSQFKDKTPVSAREATDAKRAAKQAAKGEGATVEGTTDLIAPTGKSTLEKEHSQIVRSIAKKTEKALLRKRPGLTGTNLGAAAQNTNANEVSSAVNIVIAELAAKVDKETQGMPKAERRKIFLKTLNDKLEGMSINRLAESQGKRRETEAKMKEGTLSTVAMDKENQGAETTGGALVNALSSDGTLNVKEPKVNLSVEDPGNVAPVRTLTPEKAGVAPTEKRALTKEQKAALEKRDNKLLNQYFGYRFNSKKPEVRAARIAMTPEQIFERFLQSPDPKYKWGPRAVADVQKAAARAGYDLNATTDPRKRANAQEATSEAQGSTIVQKPISPTPPTPKAGSLASGKAEVANILKEEAKVRENERRSRDYVMRKKPEVDALKGTATAQIVLEARQNDQLYTRQDGTDKFEKFAPAASQAEKIAGTVLPTTDGKYVVHKETYGRVQHSITVREQELAKREKATPAKSRQAEKEAAATPVAVDLADGVKHKVNQMKQALGVAREKFIDALNKREEALKASPPFKTRMQEMRENAREAIAKLMKDIKIPAEAVANREVNTIRKEALDWADKATSELARITKEDLKLPADNKKIGMSVEDLKKMRAEAVAPTTATATQEDVLAAIDAAAAQAVQSPPVAPQQVAPAKAVVTPEVQARRLAALEKARAAKQANAKVREAAKAAAKTAKDMASTVGDIMAIVNKGSGNTLSALAPISDLDAEKIAALKPHFAKLWEQSKQLGWDVKKFVDEVIKMIGAPAIPYFRNWASTDLKDIMSGKAVTEQAAPTVATTEAPKQRTALDLYNESKQKAALTTATTPVPPPTKADRMAKPRHVGKNKEFNDAIWENFREAMELSGLNAPLLQKQLQKYGVDTNKLVTKSNGDVVYTGLQGIVFGRAKNPDIADGLIFPVGDDQYIIFKPEQPGVTPSMLDVVTEASMHQPYPEFEAPVKNQAPKLGSKVTIGKTVEEMKGKPAEEEMTAEEYIASLPPERQEAMRQMLTAPAKPYAPVAKDPVHMKSHIDKTQRQLDVARAEGKPPILDWLSGQKNTGAVIYFASPESAYNLKMADDRIFQTTDTDPMKGWASVPDSWFSAYLKGEDVPPAMTNVAEGLLESDEKQRAGVAQLKNQAPEAIVSSVPAAQQRNLSVMSEGDDVQPQFRSFYEATLIDGNGNVMDVRPTKNPDKKAFLEKIREVGREIGAVRVVITTTKNNVPSKEHSVSKITEVRPTTAGIKDILSNQGGYTPIFEDFSHFIVNMSKAVWDMLRNQLRTMYDWVDVEHSWNAQGLHAVGFALKNFYSARDVRERMGFQQAGQLQRLINQNFGNKNTWVDHLNIVLATENTGYYWDKNKKELVKGNLDAKWFNKARPAIDWLTNYFKQSQEEFRARGVELDFVKNQQARLADRMERAKRESTKARIQELIDALDGMQFVHIPYRMVFERSVRDFVATTSEQQAQKKMQQLRTIINMNRKAPSIAMLLNKDSEGHTHIDPASINPASIVLNYSYNKGLEHAMLDVRDAVFKYGNNIVQWAEKRPQSKEGFEWQRVPHTMRLLETGGTPEKGDTLWLRTDFLSALQDSLSFSHAQNPVQKMMSWIKVNTFFNPIVLPMYNVYQLAMGGLVNPRDLAPATKEAFHDIGGLKALLGKQYGERGPRYWTMLEHGGASQPMNNPYADMEAMAAQINSMRNGTLSQFVRGIGANMLARVDKSWKTLPVPLKPLAPLSMINHMFINTTQHLAWLGDEFTRQIAFNYLKRKGHSDRNAAQLAAEMLGDYASMPARSRRIANYFFFTPTYEVSMLKYWAHMIQGAVKSAVEMIPNHAKLPEMEAKKQRRLMYGLLSTTTLLYAADQMFKHQGYEEDEKLRKYRKRIQTKEGPKDLVQVWSTPAGIPARWYHIIRKIAGSDPGNNASLPMRFFQQLKYKSHPLWQAAVNLLIENKTGGGDVIIPANAPFTEKVTRFLTYASTILTPMVSSIYGRFDKPFMEGASQRLAREHYEKESGPWMDFMVDAFLFKYVKEIPEAHAARQIKQMAQELPRDLKAARRANGGVVNKAWIDEYRNRVKAELEQLRYERTRRR